jgi:excisionase family DNA binding protein
MRASPTVIYVDAKEAARFAGMSVAALYGAVRQGVLPAYRLGRRRLRFRLDDIEAAMKRELSSK